MTMIPIEHAARQIGVAVETVADWARRGLLPSELRAPSEMTGAERQECFVDEEQLEHLAESLGWLELSAESWESTEEEG
jgi:hypothetical protein